MPFPQLLQKYYDGDLAALLLTVTWGGKDERDSDIIEDLGAQYRSYRSDLSDGKVTAFFTLRDGKWRPCEAFSLDGLFNAYVEKTELL